MSNWPNTQERDPPNTQVQSIDIDFIGTCAMVPSKTRNTSSLRVQIQGRSWIFDAGENTQVNFQKFGVSPQKIDKIFITHTHGDHILGLPGILMGIKQCRDSMIKQRRDMLKFESDENTYYQKNIPIDIYGPRGLRAYLRALLHTLRTVSHATVSTNCTTMNTTVSLNHVDAWTKIQALKNLP